MTIIRIEAYENGAHDNQTIDNVTPETFPIPEGYAVLPKALGTPEDIENFPFGLLAAEDLDGVPTVTRWDALPMPDPGPGLATEPEPTTDEVVNAIIGVG